MEQKNITKEVADLEYDTDGRVERKFTPEWASSGIVRVERIGDMVQSIVTQRGEMVKYIEALHNKLDDIMRKNKVCEFPECHTAFCTSDHK